MGRVHCTCNLIETGIWIKHLKFYGVQVKMAESLFGQRHFGRDTLARMTFGHSDILARETVWPESLWLVTHLSVTLWPETLWPE